MLDMNIEIAEQIERINQSKKYEVQSKIKAYIDAIMMNNKEIARMQENIEKAKKDLRAISYTELTVKDLDL